MTKSVDSLRGRLAKTTRRSGFSVWLGQGRNFEEFAASTKEFGVRWAEVAAWAKDEKIVGGRSFTAAAAKRAYEREKARRAAYAKAAGVVVQAALKQVTEPSPARGVRIFNASEPSIDADLTKKPAVDPAPTQAVPDRLADILEQMRRPW